MTDKDLDRFSDFVEQSLLAAVDAEPTTDRLDHFTSMWCDYLINSGEFESPESAYRRGPDFEVSGYSFEDDQSGKTILHLMISLYKPWIQSKDIEVLGNDAIHAAFERLEVFFTRSLENLSEELEETDDVFELSDRIRASRKEIVALRFHLFTNICAEGEKTLTGHVNAIEAEWEIWDLSRVFELSKSEIGSESLLIEVSDWFDEPLDCLVAKPNENYQVLLFLVPGLGLAKLYNHFGAKLLQQNVRSFLQVAGRVNKGIRQSILNEPGNFLTYNNGLSAIATGVVLTDGKRRRLKAVEGFQIVNGGQTTASLASALFKDGLDLSDISIQVKLTVVGPSGNEDFISNISRYSNTQNKVTAADFSVNSTFHRDIERLSQEIFAPEVGDSPRKSRWYYERLRGQYATELARARTPQKKKEFKALNPSFQKFGPIELAKAVNAWDQFPYLVSRGAQKNMAEFQKRLTESINSPDEAFFRKLVALQILYRDALKLYSPLCSESGMSSYRAPVTAYGISLLSHLTAQRLDLEAIWKSQSIDAATVEGLTQLFPHLKETLLNGGGSKNRHVGEWAKTIECWKLMTETSPGISRSLLISLGASGPPAKTRKKIREVGHVAADKTPPRVIESDTSPELKRFFGIAADFWFGISQWGKETGNLSPWQRSFSYNMGQLASKRGTPSQAQLVHIDQILDIAERLGFPIA